MEFEAVNGDSIMLKSPAENKKPTQNGHSSMNTNDRTVKFQSHKEAPGIRKHTQNSTKGEYFPKESKKLEPDFSYSKMASKDYKSVDQSEVQERKSEKTGLGLQS